MNLPAKQACRAFSFVELLVVLTIIGILAGLGALNYRSFQKGRSLKEAGKTLISTLRAARENAIAAGAPFQATLDLDRAAAWVDQAPPNYIPKIVTPAGLPEGTRFTRVDRAAGGATTGVVTLQFLPDGTSDWAEINVIDTADLTSSVTIRLYPSTGRARAFE